MQHPHSAWHKMSVPATLAVLLLTFPAHSGPCLLNECALFIYKRQVDWDIEIDIFLKIMILGFTKIVTLEMKERQ